MPMVATHEGSKVVRVQVNSWMYSRRVQILPDQVGIQVTVPTCNHCHTCQKRVRTFEATLAQKPEVLHQWKGLADGATWLFFPWDGEGDPLDLLRRILEIRVNGC